MTRFWWIVVSRRDPSLRMTADGLSRTAPPVLFATRFDAGMAARSAEIPARPAAVALVSADEDKEDSR